MINSVKASAITKLMNEKGLRPEFVCGRYGIKNISELNEGQYAGIVKNIDKFIEKQKEADSTK